MKLIVGLGNPGKAYANNRHNIGFRITDFLSKEFLFPNWKCSDIFLSCRGKIDGQDIILIKPSTYMNLSGEAVKNASRFYKVKNADILVFHDDLDISWGILKKKLGGGHGGHNGIRSISSIIGEDYRRVRIGIGRPDHSSSVATYVLSNFSANEEIDMENLYKCIRSDISSMVNNHSFLIEEIRFNSKQIS